VGAVTWLEILDRRERVAQRVRLDRLPIEIGRGYACDVILDDSHVSARHLRLALDPDTGGVLAEDLGSTNGLHRLDPEAARVARVALAPGTRLRIGRTIVRACGPATEVAPAVRERRDADRRRLLASPALAVPVIAAAVGLLFGMRYLASYEATAVADSLHGSVLMLAPVAAWTVAWALVSRMVAQRWLLLAHAANACAFLAAFLLVGAASEYGTFLLSSQRAVAIAGWTALGALVAALLNAHVALVSSRPRSQRWLAGGALAIALVATSAYLVHWEDGRFSNRARYPAVLKPVPGRWLGGESIDDFVAGIDGVKREVDALVDDQG